MKGRGKISVSNEVFEAIKKKKALKIKNNPDYDEEDPPETINIEDSAEANIGMQLREAAKYLG